MKNLLLLPLLFLSLTGFCTSKRMANGKWKEVKRTSPDNKVLAYTDTIHLQFLTGNEYVWQKQGGFIYRGTYKLNDKDLDITIRDFTIIHRGGDKLVLKDDSGTYEFVPDYTVATVNTLPAEAKPLPVGSIDKMVGHWSVYKSTSSTTLKEVDYDTKIKAIDITGGSSDGKLGYVYSTHDADTAPSWTIDTYDNNSQVLHCSGKSPRSLTVLKCQDNDLIIQEDNMTYFFKQFK